MLSKGSQDRIYTYHRVENEIKGKKAFYSTLKFVLKGNKVTTLKKYAVDDIYQQYVKILLDSFLSNVLYIRLWCNKM